MAGSPLIQRVRARVARALRAAAEGAPPRWNPRVLTISDALAVADGPPPVNIDRRTGAADRYVGALRQTLEAHPHGWSGGSDAGDDLATRVSARLWYHTLELPGGIVTPGTFDHRLLVPHYGIPADLPGKRVLDVGTWDGFWAFEFERRGADVTAVDLDRLSQVDLPAAVQHAVEDSGLDQRFGGGFELAREALGLNAKRIAQSVYDLDPARLGTFDLVHFGDVLMHLERPVEALRRIRSVTGGAAMISATFNPALGGAPSMRYYGGWHNAVWWSFSLDAFVQMVIDAGFGAARVGTVYRILSRAQPTPTWQAVIHAEP